MSQPASIAHQANAAPFNHGTPEAAEFVGLSLVEGRSEQTQPFTDEAREAAIQRASEAMQKHYATYEATGCFAARGDADRAMRLMFLLVKGRSPEMVARLERERGIA